MEKIFSTLGVQESPSLESYLEFIKCCAAVTSKEAVQLVLRAFFNLLFFEEEEKIRNWHLQKTEVPSRPFLTRIIEHLGDSHVIPTVNGRWTCISDPFLIVNDCCMPVTHTKLCCALTDLHKQYNLVIKNCEKIARDTYKLLGIPFLSEISSSRIRVEEELSDIKREHNLLAAVSMALQVLILAEQEESVKRVFSTLTIKKYKRIFVEKVAVLPKNSQEILLTVNPQQVHCILQPRPNEWKGVEPLTMLFTENASASSVNSELHSLFTALFTIVDFPIRTQLEQVVEQLFSKKQGAFDFHTLQAIVHEQIGGQPTDTLDFWRTFTEYDSVPEPNQDITPLTEHKITPNPPENVNCFIEATRAAQQLERSKAKALLQTQDSTKTPYAYPQPAEKSINDNASSTQSSIDSTTRQTEVEPIVMLSLPDVHQPEKVTGSLAKNSAQPPLYHARSTLSYQPAEQTLASCIDIPAAVHNILASGGNMSEGNWGEKLVASLIKTMPEFHNVVWENEISESGKPFDIFARDSSNNPVHIEVKSTSQSGSQAAVFPISIKELLFSFSAEHYELWRVASAFTPQATVTRVRSLKEILGKQASIFISLNNSH